MKRLMLPVQQELFYPGKQPSQIWTQIWWDPGKIYLGMGMGRFQATDKMKKLEDSWNTVKKPQNFLQGARELEQLCKAEKLYAESCKPNTNQTHKWHKYE